MKVLIIDDSPEKIVRIHKSLDGLVPNLEFKDVDNWAAAINYITDFQDEIDFVVCDMQFPRRPYDRIDRESGIAVLKEMKRTNIEIPIIIASSSDTVNELLAEKGFGHIPSVKASSMYDLDSQFKPWLVEIGIIDEQVIALQDELEKRKKLQKKAFVKGMLNAHFPSPLPRYHGQDPVDKESKLKKAQLKRDIKALKKSMSNKSLVTQEQITTLDKLQMEYKNMK